VPSPRAEPSHPWALAQHAPHEGPGLVAPALADAGVALRVTRLDRGEGLPGLDDLGGVVVMGGPMGVHDDRQHPWLADERTWIAEAVDRGMAVLGVCLGAQQLAAALGAPVVAGPGPEVGPGQVTLSAEGRADPVLGPDGPGLAVVHWHGDTFGIPGGAVRLASSDRYSNQAFRYGARAYGLQFHVEVDGALARQWAPELPAGVTLDPASVAVVEATGRRVLGRLVAHALAG